MMAVRQHVVWFCRLRLVHWIINEQSLRVSCVTGLVIVYTRCHQVCQPSVRNGTSFNVLGLCCVLIA